MDNYTKMAQNLVLLFCYNRSEDRGYSVSTVYIDKTTGKLISKTSETNAPYDIRPGSFSGEYEREISYSEYRKILLCSQYKAEVKNISQYKSLKESNWEQWLVNNGYLKEKE